MAGENPKSLLAYHGLKTICHKYLHDHCKINVIDIVKSPQSAVENQILATPTTVRRYPLPKKTLIGDLSNSERVALKLEIK